MKIYYVWALCALILNSCSMEEQTYSNGGPDAKDSENAGTSRVVSGYPENVRNAYDIAGKIHFEISDTYLDSIIPVHTIGNAIGATEVFGAKSTSFSQIKPIGYTPPSASRLLYVMADNPNRITEVLAQSSMGWKAQMSLSNFITGLMLLKKQNPNYAIIYQHIIAYEDSIVSETTLSATDKRIILTATSVARYGFYFSGLEKARVPRRRDRDWDISIGHICAAADGANQSTASAVSMSTAATLYGNN